MLFNLKNIQAHISKETYCNHPGRLDALPFFDEDAFLNPDSMKTIIQENGFAVINMKERNVLSILRALTKTFGQQIRDVGINKKYIARVEAVTNGKFYINTAFSQPLHSDEGYRTVFPRFVSLYCVKSSLKGGASTIIKVTELLAGLRTVFKEHVENLFCPDFIQIDTASGKVNKQLLFHMGNGMIGMSYSPILRGLETNELGYEMISWINKFIHEPANQYRFTLKENDLLMMDNCQVLHGRTAFNKQDDRLLLRFWNESISQ
ncbi:MAG: TauD/TfdA family dioxygenase [Legionella sp.]|uniref:TauD/TfdA family dioxygenase n=1 Tax=Legionella sp. TaxID=459 RepID=UPI0039E27026